MQQRHVASSRGNTYYWIAGNRRIPNKALVLLHGLTANHHLFDRQIEAFSGEYTLIAWDAPGHGTSRPYDGFSYANLAEELKRILDAESIQKAVLIGQSMGGFAAQSFIARYPGMAEGFVAIGTCPYKTMYYSKADFFWLRQIEWMAHCFSDRLLRACMARMCGVTEYARSNMIKMLGDYTRDELCRLLYLGFAGFIPEVHDLHIPCPVCLILGEHDKTGKVRQYNRHWHEKENHPLHIIKHAAHNANEDNPDAVNEIIKIFLKSVEGGNDFDTV